MKLGPIGCLWTPLETTSMSGKPIEVRAETRAASNRRPRRVRFSCTSAISNSSRVSAAVAAGRASSGAARSGNAQRGWATPPLPLCRTTSNPLTHRRPRYETREPFEMEPLLLRPLSVGAPVIRPAPTPMLLGRAMLSVAWPRLRRRPRYGAHELSEVGAPVTRRAGHHSSIENLCRVEKTVLRGRSSGEAVSGQSGTAARRRRLSGPPGAPAPGSPHVARPPAQRGCRE